MKQFGKYRITTSNRSKVQLSSVAVWDENGKKLCIYKSFKPKLFNYLRAKPSEEREEFIELMRGVGISDEDIALILNSDEFKRSDVGNVRKTEDNVCYVYAAKYDGKYYYIGRGKNNRYTHCNSGTSSSYTLNQLHFQGVVFEIEFIGQYLSYDESLILEHELIDKHQPEGNIMLYKSSKVKEDLYTC